ncbi:MAG: hypothetical protein K0R39_3133 [Symbiobacteriaceae bacterium]|nr:hypothetical protein [Symbiobacteriaceae bacterium]
MPTLPAPAPVAAPALPDRPSAVPPLAPGPLPAPTATPAEVATPQAKPLVDVDLDGDGQAEQLVISGDHSLRVVDKAGAERFAINLPALMVADTKAEIFLIPGRPPLVRAYWPACPYGYPDNIFIAYDQAKKAVISNRDPKTVMACGTYEHLGNGRFEVLSRNNNQYYRSVMNWQGDGFAIERSGIQLSRVRNDQLVSALDTLGNDIENPEVLFASPELYEQFVALSKGFQHLEAPKKPTPGSFLLQAMTAGKLQGQLLVTFQEDPKNPPFVLVTGLEWSPAK